MVFTSPLEPVPYLFREAWGVFLTSEGATSSGTLTTPKCVPTALCVDDTLETYGQCGFSNRNVVTFFLPEWSYSPPCELARLWRGVGELVPTR